MAEQDISGSDRLSIVLCIEPIPNDFSENVTCRHISASGQLNLASRLRDPRAPGSQGSIQEHAPSAEPSLISAIDVSDREVTHINQISKNESASAAKHMLFARQTVETKSAEASALASCQCPRSVKTFEKLDDQSLPSSRNPNRTSGRGLSAEEQNHWGPKPDNEMQLSLPELQNQLSLLKLQSNRRLMIARQEGKERNIASRGLTPWFKNAAVYGCEKQLTFPEQQNKKRSNTGILEHMGDAERSLGKAVKYDAAQDYEIQLMLLEQQNKKRLKMAGLGDLVVSETEDGFLP